MSRQDALHEKRVRFANEYLIDLNGAAAAVRAGFSPLRAKQTAHDLLQRDDVKAIVAAGQAKVSETTGIAADKVIAELVKLGFSNMLDYVRIDEDGLPYTDFSALTRDQAAALTEITVETRTETEVDEAGDRKPVPVRKVRFKLADKRSALVDLGKHLGLFKERAPGDTGNQPNPAELTDLEAARRIAFVLAKGARAPQGN